MSVIHAFPNLQTQLPARANPCTIVAVTECLAWLNNLTHPSKVPTAMIWRTTAVTIITHAHRASTHRSVTALLST